MTRRTSRQGAGVILVAGIESRATRRWSVPFKVEWFLARPADDVSGQGANLGITYTWSRADDAR